MQRLIAIILITGHFLLPNPANAAEEDDLNRLLDGFHQAAARADYSDYFSRFSKESVFLGTDATERWTINEFKAYTKPHFAGGRGWTYIPQQRFWRVQGDIAWFDEQLENANLGRCRGTGVAVREDGKWKVAHYSLTMLIPNGIAGDVAARAKQVKHEP
tara:strand:+ start:2052 stop:2528 length:477 start_codon:yes stop_codon:yes gene_type:complete